MMKAVKYISEIGGGWDQPSKNEVGPVTVLIEEHGRIEVQIRASERLLGTVVGRRREGAQAREFERLCLHRLCLHRLQIRNFVRRHERACPWPEACESEAFGR